MLLCDPDTHLPPVQLQLPSFFKFGVEISLFGIIPYQWSGKKLNVFKMRFTTFYKFWNYYLVVNGWHINITGPTIGILPGTQVVYLSFIRAYNYVCDSSLLSSLGGPFSPGMLRSDCRPPVTPTLSHCSPSR